jgi:hypothetical protein|tara:strand:- start:321 stop:566 length:246 start_codon:yes stop_codon:yes gene_type:complete
MGIAFNPFFDISGLTVDELDAKHKVLSKKLDTAYNAHAHVQVIEHLHVMINMILERRTTLMITEQQKLTDDKAFDDIIDIG